MSSRTRTEPKAYWVQNNPVLKAGQYAIEEETGRHKFGDGTTPWLELDSFLPVQKLLRLLENSGGGGSAALPLRLEAQTAVIADPDTAVETGFYFIFNTADTPKLPEGTRVGALIAFATSLPNGSNPVIPTVVQQFIAGTTVYVRTKSGSTWSAWSSTLSGTF